MAMNEEVTLKKLEVFLEFMRLGNMAKVAEALDQSTVSVHRSLHSLQEGLRCPLFKRDGRALIPLPTAHVFAEYASRAVRECEEGVRKARESAGFGANRIKIGCSYSLTVRPIPQLLYGLKSRRSQLDVDLTVGSTRELIQKLKDDQLDALIVVMAVESTDSELTALTLFEDEVSFAAPLGSRYAKRRTIDLADAMNERFVASREDFLAGQVQQQTFERAGFVPYIAMRASNLFSLANLVAQGAGYALLPNRVAMFTSNVQLIPLDPKYRSSQKITLLLPKARERDPNLLALTAECRAFQRAVTPG